MFQSFFGTDVSFKLNLRPHGSAHVRGLPRIPIRRKSNSITRNSKPISCGGEEVGGRDLIYWVSQEKGIAFELYYNRKVGHRLIYKVIVFEAGSQFFPEGCIVPPQEWHELPPYTLELEGYPPPRMPRPARSPVER